MEKYKPVESELFSAISSTTDAIQSPGKYNYSFCSDCGNSMILDSQKGTYICNACNLQQDIVGGLSDCDPSASSIVKMYGSKSVIRHRSGKDMAEQIGEKYYKKFMDLNDKYVVACVEEALEMEKMQREKQSKSSSEMSSSSNIDDNEIAMTVAKTSRIPKEILVCVAKTYAEVFLFSKKKEFNETGELLEVRDSRKRGTKLWAFIAYLLLQECAKQKHPFNETEAVKFVRPQQPNVSIAVGDRIARDYHLKGYLVLPQMNTAKGAENIEQNLKLLGLPIEHLERFIGFVSDIMQTVTNEGVAIRTEEKTQIVGSIYIIIQRLGFKIDADTISKKCKIQTKTFMNFAGKYYEKCDYIS